MSTIQLFICITLFRVVYFCPMAVYMMYITWYFLVISFVEEGNGAKRPPSAQPLTFEVIRNVSQTNCYCYIIGGSHRKRCAS